MTAPRRTDQGATGDAPRVSLRSLLCGLLIAGFVAAQGAALVHSHVDDGHEGPCAVCRVADDAAQALDAPGLVALDLEPTRVEPGASAPRLARAASRRAHPPRAPPIA